MLSDGVLWIWVSGYSLSVLARFTTLLPYLTSTRIHNHYLVHSRFTRCASASFRIGYCPIQPVMLSRRLSAAGIRFSQHPLPTGELAVPRGSVTGQGQTPLGLSCSAFVRSERVRCLLYAGAYGARAGFCEAPFSCVAHYCRISHLSAAGDDDACEDSLFVHHTVLRLALGLAMATFSIRLFVSASHPTVTSDARETGD